MEQNLMTIIAFAAGLLAIVVSTYGAIITARVNAWSKAKLAEHGLTEAAKWQADLKAGLLTGAKAALLEGKSIPDAIKAAITHTLTSNSDAAAGLKPSPEVLERLAKAAVADAVKQAADAWRAPKVPTEMPRNVDPHFGVNVPAFSIPQPYRASDPMQRVQAGDPPGSIDTGSLSASK